MSRLKIKFQEAKNATKSDSESHSLIHCRPAKSKPPLQCIKINTDVAIRDGSSLTGVVARDQKGKILKIKAVKCHSDIPKVAEAFGVLQGLLLAKEEGWNKIWCESNIKSIILRLNNPDSQTSH